MVYIYFLMLVCHLLTVYGCVLPGNVKEHFEFIVQAVAVWKGAPIAGLL